MFAQLVSTYHLHPVVDHFTIALLTFGIAAEILSSATVLISRGRRGRFAVWGEKLRSTSLLLMIAGAIGGVLSELDAVRRVSLSKEITIDLDAIWSVKHLGVAAFIQDPTSLRIEGVSGVPSRQELRRSRL